MGLLSPIHVALAGALAGAPPIAGGRIYDAGNVPGEPETPFVVLGQIRATRDDDKGDDDNDGHGIAFTQIIEIWARGNRGKKDAEEIVDAIYDRLHDNPIALPGSPPPGTMVTLACEEQSVDLEPDGLTTRGEMTFEGHAHT